MPLTKSEYEEVLKLSCKLCRAGNEPIHQAEPFDEYVHQTVKEMGGGARSFSNQFCLATGVRRAYRGKFVEQSSSGNS